MNISVELTLTPLQDTFEEPIKAFIKKLRLSDLNVVENPLSTHIYGDYDRVMQLLLSECKEALQMIDQGLLLIKIVKSDRSNYAPDF